MPDNFNQIAFDAAGFVNRYKAEPRDGLVELKRIFPLETEIKSGVIKVYEAFKALKEKRYETYIESLIIIDSIKKELATRDPEYWSDYFGKYTVTGLKQMAWTIKTTNLHPTDTLVSYAKIAIFSQGKAAAKMLEFAADNRQETFMPCISYGEVLDYCSRNISWQIDHKNAYRRTTDALKQIAGNKKPLRRN